jgi:hypothetical protein
MFYKDPRTIFEERIQNYKKKCHNHILQLDFSRLAQNVKNCQWGEEMLDYREDDRRMASEMEWANKSQPLNRWWWWWSTPLTHVDSG